MWQRHRRNRGSVNRIAINRHVLKAIYIYINLYGAYINICYIRPRVGGGLYGMVGMAWYGLVQYRTV